MGAREDNGDLGEETEGVADTSLEWEYAICVVDLRLLGRAAGAGSIIAAVEFRLAEAREG